MKVVAPSDATAADTHAWAVLQRLLCGRVAAADQLANALRVEAQGHTTFGRTDAIDLFTAHPLVLSSDAQCLGSPQALAVFDETPDGRSVGAFADLVDGVIARLWVVSATPPGAVTEPAVAVARDDFMSQLRQRCQGEAIDHPDARGEHWPRVVDLGHAVLEASQTLERPLIPSPVQPPEQPLAAASSSQVWVVRAFSTGDLVVALYRLRVQATTPLRRAQDRWALAVAAALPAAHLQDQNQRAQPQPRLAVSGPLPEPAPVEL